MLFLMERIEDFAEIYFSPFVTLVITDHLYTVSYAPYTVPDADEIARLRDQDARMARARAAGRAAVAAHLASMEVQHAAAA